MEEPAALQSTQVTQAHWIRLHADEAGLDTAASEIGADIDRVRALLRVSHRRPKLEIHGGILYGISLFVEQGAAAFERNPDDIVHELVCIFTDDAVLAISKDSDGVGLLDEVESPERSDPTLPPGQRVLDRVTARFIALLERIDSGLDELEDLVFARKRDHGFSEELYLHKRRLLELRRATEPLTFFDLGADDDRFDEKEMRTLRTIERRYNQTLAIANDLMEECDSMIDADLAQLSQRQTEATLEQSRISNQFNDDVRKISAWGAIITVPTALTGVWGMNFEHMPELAWYLGYPLALLVIVGSLALLYWQFRRVGWL